MLDTAHYLVTRSIAERCGVISRRYRTADGRYIIDNKDLARVRLTSEEYITGLQGVEKITESQAKKLIIDGHFAMGAESEAVTTEAAAPVLTEEPVDTPSEPVEGTESEENTQGGETPETEENEATEGDEEKENS